MEITISLDAVIQIVVGYVIAHYVVKRLNDPG